MTTFRMKCIIIAELLLIIALVLVACAPAQVPGEIRPTPVPQSSSSYGVTIDYFQGPNNVGIYRLTDSTRNIVCYFKSGYDSGVFCLGSLAK